MCWMCFPFSMCLSAERGPLGWEGGSWPEAWTRKRHTPRSCSSPRSGSSAGGHWSRSLSEQKRGIVNISMMGFYNWHLHLLDAWLCYCISLACGAVLGQQLHPYSLKSSSRIDATYTNTTVVFSIKLNRESFPDWTAWITATSLPTTLVAATPLTISTHIEPLD